MARGPTLRKLARLVRDRRGIAAVEFALIVPVMVTLCFGSVEVCNAVSLDRMVSLTAGTVANLVSQYTTISSSTQMPDGKSPASDYQRPRPAAPCRPPVP
jgi:Flp pilus assembly protein TadG